jgi:DNA-directed RNA polymerase specialized sigma24 family protein
MDVPDWPDPDVALALWRGLPNDPTAPTYDAAATADFCAAFLGPLGAHLTARWPHADEHLVQEAAERAVLEALRRPDGYNPALSPLRAYLCRAARRDLSNLVRAEGRHHRGRIPFDLVADAGAPGNEEEDDLWASLADPRVAAVLAALDPVERAVWELMLAGERATAEYIPILNITNWPTDEQEREAKRVKDRIKKRLQRAKEDRV